VVIHLGQSSPIASSELPASHNDANNIWKLIRSCTRWGLQALTVARETGGLLHHPFSLTCDLR